MHRFLVIGYGVIGSKHASHLEAGDMACVAGIYDTDPQRRKLAHDRGFPVFDRMEDLRDCGADAAIVTTPNDSHFSIVCSLLQSGLHVLVEKPAALNENELSLMYQEADKAGKILSVHQNRRFDRDFTTIRQVLEQNLLGEPFRLESRIHGSRGVPSGWRKDPDKGGGMLYDWGVHLIDQAVLAFQGASPERVYCRMSHVQEKAVDDGFSLNLDYPDGKSVFIEVSTLNYIPLPRFYLCGRSGTAIINDWQEPCRVTQCIAFREEDVRPALPGNAVTKTMAPRDELTTRSFLVEPQPVDSYALLRNFCAAMEGRETLLITREQTLLVMRIIDAAFQSAAAGRPVSINSKTGAW